MTKKAPTLLMREQPTLDCHRIDTDLLIPGRGQPIEHASLIYKDGKIIYAGPQKDLPDEFSSLSETKVPVLMPGLWDCHLHFMGMDQLFLDRVGSISMALAGARSARDIAATLNAGFTSVRELAGYGAELSKAINEGWLVGPNIYSSVALLSQTGGHGDLHSLPLELVQDGIIHGLPLAICDGVEECIKTVRKQVRRGAKIIKVCATGGVLTVIDSPQCPQFSPAELEAIVQEAARTDMVVAAHCHGKRGIMAALHAGVRTIEHGSFLDQEAIDLMLEKEAMLIATRSVVEFGIANQQDLAPPSRAKMRETASAHKRSYAMAVKAGIKCALGTDLGVSSNAVHFNHGMNGGEFHYAVVAGMTPLEAIEAGTANGPATLGPQAPMSGQLKEGFDADFIALNENPLDDIKILAAPEKITHVWKGGKLFKAPGKAVGLLP